MQIKIHEVKCLTKIYLIVASIYIVVGKKGQTDQSHAKDVILK